MVKAYVVKVKGIDEIRHVLSSPGSNVVVENVVVIGICPFLDKHHVRRMVGGFGKDIAASGPRRHNIPSLAPACNPMLATMVAKASL